MRVKPANPDVVIRDPHTKRPLSPDGDEVPDNSFWHRRIRAGEVVLVEDESDAPDGEQPSTAKGTQPMPTRPRAPGRGVDVATEPEPPVGNEPIAPLTTRKPRS